MPSPIIPGGEPFFFPGGKVGCLLIHGLTGTPYEVRELGQRLNAAGYTAVGIRLPGHATRYQDLDTVPWSSWEGAVDVGWDLLAQQCDQVFLMGMSMGADLALHAATRHPATGVVAMGTTWELPRWRLALARRLVNIWPYQRKRGGSSILDPVARAKHPTYDHMNLHAVLQFEQLLAVMRDELPDVTCPVLLVHARQDPVASPEGVSQILAALGSQNKAIHWVDHSSHIITEDYSKEEVFQVVLEWVARVSATAAAEAERDNHA